MMLEVKDLKIHFPTKSKGVVVKAVDGLSFTINKGEIFGIVGESGCGKTTLAKAILGLVPETSGEILFEGQNLQYLLEKRNKEFRKKIQLIFQDPYLSVNPRMRVSDVIAEGIDIHGLAKNKEERNKKITELMETVGVDSKSMFRYPIEFSAGQRQRFAIARALAVNPDFLICDEPVSALDVSIQDQILKLLLNLRGKFGLTYLFITHDLAVVRLISDRIAVMYLGKIVEYARKEDLFSNPQHPYTKALFAAVPIPDPRAARKRGKIELLGEIPSASWIPAGCRFHTRCPIADEKCLRLEPELMDVGAGHLIACHKIAGGEK